MKSFTNDHLDGLIDHALAGVSNYCYVNKVKLDYRFYSAIEEAIRKQQNYNHSAQKLHELTQLSQEMGLYE